MFVSVIFSSRLYFHYRDLSVPKIRSGKNQQSIWGHLARIYKASGVIRKKEVYIQS